MNNIKAIRKEQGISVTELAAKLNMSQGNLTKIENNQVELKRDIAIKIASALGVSPEAIQNEPPSSNALKDIPLINPEALSLPPLSRLKLPTTLIGNIDTTKTELFVSPDDTMMPLIATNALVLIDKSNQTPANGIFLIKINNQVYLRRLQTTFTNKISLLCDNPAYEPQQMDISSIEIIGKALSSFGLKVL